MAQRQGAALRQWLVTLLATAGTVGAANAFNCFMERSLRSLHGPHRRSAAAASRMDPTFALLFAISLSLASVPALSSSARLAAAARSVCSRCSSLRARVHAAQVTHALGDAGGRRAGRAAAADGVDSRDRPHHVRGGLAVFAMLFVWQLPHFIAIALFRKDDYRERRPHEPAARRTETTSRGAARRCTWC